MTKNLATVLLPGTREYHRGVGVPQGSVCGPLLFLLYIDDIAHIMKNCKVSLYADDTVLYVAKDDIDTARIHIYRKI